MKMVTSIKLRVCWIGFSMIGCFASGAWVSAGDEPEEGQQEGPNIDALIDAIPSASLDAGIVLQSGEIKIALATVEGVETANIAAQKKRSPEFSLTDDMR